ncbi:MAG TPA: SxtJ family membrane protein [Planctomycetota bacterium]|nr:SxtJ family membrane protein [Planctomycetota bacterium]
MLELNLKPELRILRQFAFVAVVGLPMIAAVVLRLAGAFSWTHPAMLAAAAVGLLQLALFLGGVQIVTRALYVTIMVIALPIGFVISQVLMATIFYLVVTPIGLVFRLAGRDVLGRSLERSRTSYWRDRGPARDRTSYFKLY